MLASTRKRKVLFDLTYMLHKPCNVATTSRYFLVFSRQAMAHTVVWWAYCLLIGQAARLFAIGTTNHPNPGLDQAI